MRKIHTVAPKLEAPEQNTWKLELQTMTPMFGGSAKPREVDAGNPVRAASVRGHLRFWWRATAGARFSSAKELFEAEEKIWGSTKQHGKVSVRVTNQRPGQGVRPSEIVPDKGTAKTGPMERFFLHPFNENKNEGVNEASGMRTVQFRLEVQFAPETSDVERAEVRTALRAWIAFGGIGARTRRGLGSLEPASEQRTDWLAANPVALETWFKPHQGQDTTSHATLANARARFGKVAPKSDAEEAWRTLGKFWTRFRKGHFTDRRRDYSPLSGSSWEDHRTLQDPSRADRGIELVKPYFGLPIVYQKFKNSDAFAGTLDAVSENGSRMASPVILKPVAFADGTVRPMVLVLNAPRPLRIKIGNQELDLNVPRYDRVLTALEVQDPLEAVLKAARLSGFTEEVHL
jgi:CRISPR-associated protein Cmr1